jgi:hypothetical protein
MAAIFRAVLAGLAGTVLALVLAACTPADQTGSMASRVRSWVRSSDMGQNVGTVLGDAARVTAAVAGGKDAGIIHTDCLVLLNDTGNAVDQLPTPDERLTTMLSNGYEDEADAATDCDDAGSQNQQLLTKSATERANGRTLLEHALIRAEALAGMTISTTTTTQPDVGGIFG